MRRHAKWEDRLTVSPRGLSPTPTKPYSAALGESSHWMDVLMKKDLTVVKYPAEKQASALDCSWQENGIVVLSCLIIILPRH